jgi:hypothetical protein
MRRKPLTAFLMLTTTGKTIAQILECGRTLNAVRRCGSPASRQVSCVLHERRFMLFVTSEIRVIFSS